MNPALRGWYSEQLKRCRKAYKAGNEAGLYDALCYCQEKRELDTPDWVLNAMLARQRDFMLGVRPAKKGRHAKWIRQIRADMIDYDRTECVEECRAIDVRWVDVYAKAAEILAGTFSEGNESTIEASYKRFKKRQKQNPYRYYIPRYVRVTK